jgi:hypothetical protein
MKIITYSIPALLFLLQGCESMSNPENWKSLARNINSNYRQPYNANPQFTQPPMAGDGPFHHLEGGKIVAQDGTFLGVITSNQFDDKSICNRFGNYGSKFSATSIWNEYGDYGSQYSEYSPWNPYSSNPPHIVTVNGARYLLTKNRVLGGVNTSMIKGIADSISE